ncbi:MAG TPA: DUF4236 domain-containing protein [Thermoanaerobaculia bacterium]|jgi:hypothetical protein
MGFYLRKSVSVGPFRFNLSGSGVGMSVGVPGFRVGSGPRGNYVRIGRGGIYYQQTLPSGAPARPAQPYDTPRIPIRTHEPLREIESVSASLIVDSSSEELLAEIRRKRAMPSLTPLAIAFAILAIFVGLNGSGAVFIAACVLGCAAIVAARYRDKVAKTAVILYELEPHVESSFQRFTEWAEAVSSTRRAWHISATGTVHDRKYHAGASALVQRTPTSLRIAEPPFLRTNVPVFAVGAGRQTLYFLPDRLLVYDASGVGAIHYPSLDVTVSSQRFIETESLPSDATVVGHTWRYVNKSGGPDRRFSNNPQIPICNYDELHLRTASGLNEVVQLSRAGIGEGFASAIRHLATVVSS